MAEGLGGVDDLQLPDGAERAKRALLFIDIVESVRLVEQDETQVIARWLGFVEHVRSGILPHFNGRLVKNLGDGMLLDFADVRSALAAAFAIQHASNRSNLAHPPDRQLLLRMGVEVSDVIVEHGDVHGHGVNLAARLMTLAGPGEIVISTRVRDHLTPALDAEVEDLGECFLRHLDKPVRAYRVGPPGARPVVRPSMPAEELAPYIAIVPLATRHGETGQAVIGEVLAEQIIHALSRSNDMNVISRLSTTAFRGRDVAFADISAHLNADYVLSGSYALQSGEVAVEVELAEARSGRILWTDRLRERFSGEPATLEALALRLASEVEAAILKRELQRAKLQPLPTLKAYTLLLSAIAMMHRLSLDDFEEARHYLQTLIDRTGRQSIPLAWLANWHVLRVQQGWSVDSKQDSQKALECTKRALDADPDCSLALAIDGFVHTNLLKQLDIAKQRYDRAIQVNPNEGLAHLLRGTLHAFRGEGQPAVRDTQRALRLSPLDPNRYFYDSLAAGAYLAAGQNKRALNLAKRSLLANRHHTSTLRIMAVAQWRLGRHEPARATAQELLRLEPSLTISRWRARSPSADYAVGEGIAETLRAAGVPE